jgi:hypothetical protein
MFQNGNELLCDQEELSCAFVALAGREKSKVWTGLQRHATKGAPLVLCSELALEWMGDHPSTLL